MSGSGKGTCRNNNVMQGECYEIFEKNTDEGVCRIKPRTAGSWSQEFQFPNFKSFTKTEFKTRLFRSEALARGRSEVLSA